MSTTELEKRVAAIEARNKKVEGDKAWETSWTRKCLILLFTYIAISLYFMVIHVDRPFINAVVPAVGFWLSTLSMPYFKQAWLAKHHTKK